jgi:hypothetical protein
VSYDLWTRWDRVACRVAGHSWLDHQCEWLGSPAQFSTCVRCGASGTLLARRRHRLART